MADVKTKRASQKDGGFGWAVVFAFFMSSIIIDALRYAFGLLYIEFLSEFHRGKGETAWIGSTMICVYNILGPVIAVGINRFGVRISTVVGAVIATVGLVASAFATQIYYLFFTYGVIQGFGLGVMYLGGWVAVGRYFEKKRGLALGVAQCGCGVGAFAISPVLTILIDVYAWRGAMLILGGICLNGCVLSMLYRPLVEDFEDIIELSDGEIGNKANEVVVENGKLLVKTSHPTLRDEGNVNYLSKSNTEPEYTTKQTSSTIDRLRNFLCAKETAVDSEPRSFAEMREQQLENYKNHIHKNVTQWPSVRSVISINSISYIPSILGSDASLERVLARRRRNVHRDVSLSIVDIELQSDKDASSEAGDYKQFSCMLLEKLFPRRLVSDAKLLLLMASALFYSMATFVPITLIADYGRVVGCAENEVGWFVSAMGIGGAIGRVICGFVVDITCVNNVWFLSGMLAICSAVNFLCPLMTTFPVLMMFSLVYGICIGSLYVVPAVILIDLFGAEFIAETMGVLMYTCGIVALIGTPIGGWLFDVTESYTYSFFFSGGLFLLATVFNTLVRCTCTKAKTIEHRQNGTTEHAQTLPK